MISVLILMSLISIVMRILPFLFSNSLQKIKILDKLTPLLPTCFMLLLVVHNLKDVSYKSYPFGLAEIGGLFMVILMQSRLRNVMVSMAAGVLTHQFLLWIST